VPTKIQTQTPAETLSPFLSYEEFQHEWFDVGLAGQINVGKNGSPSANKGLSTAKAIHDNHVVFISSVTTHTAPAPTSLLKPEVP